MSSTDAELDQPEGPQTNRQDGRLFRDLREKAARRERRRVQRVQQLLAQDAATLKRGGRGRGPAGRGSAPR